MQKRRFNSYALVILAVALTAGCGNPQKKLDAARAAENTGNRREASNLFAVLVIESSHSIELSEASKGKHIRPDAWMNEINKYIKWFTESATAKNDAFREALDGLGRTAGRFESDNTFHASAPERLDSFPAFAEQWNQAFNPPSAESAADWNGLVRRAAESNFSFLRISSPRNYTYDVNVINRKNSRRLNFTLYSESQTLAPLPPGDYTVIVRSSVDFQPGQRWTSEYSVLDLKTPDVSTLLAISMRTRVAKKE